MKIHNKLLTKIFWPIQTKKKGKKTDKRPQPQKPPAKVSHHAETAAHLTAMDEPNETRPENIQCNICSRKFLLCLSVS